MTEALHLSVIQSLRAVLCELHHDRGIALTEAMPVIQSPRAVLCVLHHGRSIALVCDTVASGTPVCVAPWLAGSLVLLNVLGCQLTY